MCADGSRGAMNVKGAFSESGNPALLHIYAFPLKHNHFVPSYFTRMLLLCSKLHLAHEYLGLSWCLINNTTPTVVKFIKCHAAIYDFKDSV